MHRIDAREEFGVQIQPAPMRGQARSHVTLDPLKRVTGMGGGQIGKNCVDACQKPAAVFQRRDGVGEIGRGAVTGDGADLRIMLGQGAIIGGRKMLWPDAVERRGAERRGPGFEKGIFHRLYIRQSNGFPI